MIVYFICGKGGTGKTTVTATLAEHFSISRKVLVISIDRSRHMAACLRTEMLTGAPREIRTNLFGIHLQRQQVLEDFVTRFLKLKFLSRKILDHPLFPYLSATAPGIREFLILDRIRELTKKSHKNLWEIVLVDAPATGHAIQLLNLPDQLTALLKLGPMRIRLNQILRQLKNADSTQAVLITVPRESAVQETLNLHHTLTDTLKINTSTLVINRFPSSFVDGPNPQSMRINEESDPRKLMIKTLGKKNTDAILGPVEFMIQFAANARRAVKPLQQLNMDKTLILPRVSEYAPSEIVLKLTQEIPEDCLGRR